MSRRQRIIGNVVLCDSVQDITFEQSQVEERIRARAFEISAGRGHAGRELDDWLSAESEIVMSPPVEVAEKNGTFVISLAPIGVDPKDLTVMATTDRILVKADFRHEHEPDAVIHSCEFKAAMLFRFVSLPEAIELGSMKMEFREGILRIIVRRVGAAEAEEKPKRKVAARKTRAKKT